MVGYDEHSLHFDGMMMRGMCRCPSEQHDAVDLTNHEETTQTMELRGFGDGEGA